MNRVTSRIAAAVLLTPGLVMIGSAPARATTYHCQGRVATIVGTRAANILRGTSGDDVIVGLGGSDSISGAGGDDVICGNKGGDNLVGGAGDDVMHGKRGSDFLVGGDGNDVLYGGVGDESGFRADAGDDQWYSRTPTDRLEYDDTVSLDLLSGTSTGVGSDGLHLGGGISTVQLFAPDSTVLGSDHRDLVVGLYGGDTVDGRGGDDFVSLEGQGSVAHGGPGNDDLRANGGDPEDTLYGDDGDDSLLSQGNTTVSGGAGNDTVTQLLGCSQCGAGAVDEFTSDHQLDGGDGDGNDTLVVKDLEDPFYNAIAFDMSAGTLDADGTVAPVTGFENLSVSNPSSTTYDVTGTDGPNTITWFESLVAVQVHALGGDDTISGGDANDTLDGGAGDDTADGRGGTDTCTSIEHRTSCEVANP